METMLTFDDVLLSPRFSEVVSRKDVDTSEKLCGIGLKFPVISANMDTVTDREMAIAMAEYGAIGALHRFQSIENNVKQFNFCTPHHPIVSIGLGKLELERAEALYQAGANVFLVDVAHGASMQVVKQVKELRKLLHHSARIIVGNFANARSIKDFNYQLDGEVEAYKIGIGGGSLCRTRIVTGAGCPTFASLLDCSKLGVDLIADGGIRNSGDLSKSLAVPNVRAVMCGRLLAGTDESPGEIFKKVLMSDGTMINYEKSNYTDEEILEDVGALRAFHDSHIIPCEVKYYKKYRGSASQESYEVQGKIADHRTPEGVNSLVPYVGPIRNILQQLESGLRSSMSYLGANNLQQFRQNAEFIRITDGGYRESLPHGKL